MLKNNLRVNNLYYQTNCNNGSRLKVQQQLTTSTSSLGSNQDPYQGSGLNMGLTNKRRVKNKQGFAKSYLALEGSKQASNGKNFRVGGQQDPNKA